jgi:NAD(P)-dependent dehydrogenase (short-subunit alcohol dehydrogenase family)
MGLLDGKVAIVTGAGRGLGRSHAHALAAEGAAVIVNDLGGEWDGRGADPRAASETAGEITAAGGRAEANFDDVADWEGGQRLINQAVETYGKLDILVCNAGFVRDRTVFNMTEDEWDDVVRVHLKGTFSLFRHASALMRKQNSGSLVAFTSGAFQGSVAQANYAAAKGGVVSLVRSAALGLYRYGVRANAIAPVARTRMSENVPAGLAEIGEPEDVAPMVVYLLSDRASHVTGQIYTAVGSRIAVWNQPQEVRSMTTDGRWTPEQIADRLDEEIGQEEMPLMRPLKEALEEAQQAAT